MNTDWTFNNGVWTKRIGPFEARVWCVGAYWEWRIFRDGQAGPGGSELTLGLGWEAASKRMRSLALDLAVGLLEPYDGPYCVHCGDRAVGLTRHCAPCHGIDRNAGRAP
jgi:hypothetical protein